MFPQWVIVGGLLLCVFLLIHPFWTHRPLEPFQSQGQIQYEFQGTRWTNSQILEFSNQLKDTHKVAMRQQTMLQTVLADYLRVSKPLEQSAYERQRQLESMDPETREMAGLENDQIQEYYGPMNIAKRQGNDPIVAIRENPQSLRTTLPQIVFPLIGDLDSPDYYNWYTMGDGKERYDKEEEFYKQVELVLPSFVAAVREFHKNAVLLRKSAGERTWGLLPRVEAMQQRVTEAEKKAEESKTEGFQAQKLCEPVFIRQIKTIPFSTYFTMAKTVRELLEECQTLIQNAETDLQTAEQMLKKIQENGDAKRERGRAAAN